MTPILHESRVVIADDDEPIRELLADILEPEGVRIHLTASGEEAIAAIDTFDPDALIVDILMPPPDGLAVLEAVRSRGINLPVLVITAQPSSTVTIKAMQNGAYDFLAKPFDPDDILRAVRRAIEHSRLTRRLANLEQQLGRRDPRDVIIGRSAPMQEVYKLIGRVADYDTTVLITGESGTGKELVANVLHRSSARHSGPFVAVNCSALPETLLESELFGHEKGAFTGAVARRKGRFEQAAAGTLFLDEIGEMTGSMQKRLLRVLQERTFERVGGNLPVKADVRVITATNRDLTAEVEAGRFREDLFYRLNVVNIHMPSLRDRKDDIPYLVDHFLHKYRPGDDNATARLTEAALERLVAYDWPGNVRELENTIERAIVLAQDGLIAPEHLALDKPGDRTSDMLARALDMILEAGGTLDSMVDDLRQRLIERSIERHNGDRAASARALGITDDDQG